LPNGNHGMKQLLALPVADVVEVLHAHDVEVRPGRLDVGHRHLRQSHVPDEAFLLHLPNDLELLVGMNVGIDAVQLPQVDAVDAKAAE
jgi:hypothetical protein